jgi:hypothetical protein
VSVSGVNVGSFGASARLQLQGTAFASSSWISTTCVVSRYPSLGILPSVSVDVVASVANSAVIKSDLFSLSDSLTSALYPMSNTAKSGSATLTIFGKGFGVIGDSPRSFLGVSECRTIWISDSSFQLKSSMSSIPFSGILFQSKNYSAISKFDAVSSSLRMIDDSFSNFVMSGYSSKYWPELICNLSQIIRSNISIQVYSQVYAAARSIPIRWNSSHSDQENLANLSISLMYPHNNYPPTILNLAVSIAMIRASSIISEISHEEIGSRFCGLNFVIFQAAIAEFATLFMDSGGRYFIINSAKMCTASPSQQTQLSHQILMCMLPAFVPLFFSSLLTIAPKYSLYHLSAEERQLGSSFSAVQVTNICLRMRSFATLYATLTPCSSRIILVLVSKSGYWDRFLCQVMLQTSRHH